MVSIFEGEDQIGYSKKVIEHFENPRNVGSMEDADATAKVGSAVCGDIVKYYLKVKDNKIEDIKFQSFGCASNIATGSIITEMVKGKPIKEAKKINFKAVEEELGGLPEVKMHCSILATKALHVAVSKYEVKQGMRKIDEDFVREILQGVMDPLSGENILAVNKVEKISVEEEKITIQLSIKETSKTAEKIEKAIRDSFEGIETELEITFG